MIQFCEVCAEPASLGTLGDAQMHWRCASCFARPQVTWATPEPDPIAALEDTTIAPVAVGTGVTVTLGAKTARLVAAALDEWLMLTTARLNAALSEEEYAENWDWNDVPMVSGAAKIIRDAELALGLPDAGPSVL